MLRIYFVQQWYGLADEAVEDALYDSPALRGFAGIELNRDPVPEATTVLHFRHWLEKHELTQSLFDEVGSMLAECGLLMRQRTIPAFARTDATIIAAPASTKNKAKARDPEMHQTKKGNQWHFGMKAHIGVDAASGVVHSLTGTAANEADIPLGRRSRSSQISKTRKPDRSAAWATVSCNGIRINPTCCSRRPARCSTRSSCRRRAGRPSGSIWPLPMPASPIGLDERLKAGMRSSAM
jgi:hypothetical protein